MATEAEKQQLIEVLKFTPRTYTVNMWGYGGEYVMGTTTREIYDYFRSRRLSVSDFAWDSDYAEDNNIPEEMWPFEPGAWHDCDDMAHVHGVDRSSGTIQICDETGAVIFERSLEDCDGDEDSPQFGWGDEVWIDSQSPGTVVFVGTSSEKGSFFEGEINLRQPFDISKLEISVDEVDGNEIVSMVTYDSEDIDNNGANTNGKGSEFGFYIAGSQHNGKWQRYRDMDDIEYTLTDWFDANTNPVRDGVYEVTTQEGHTYHATWNGTDWKNSWSDDALTITQWRGIAYDPDEQELRDQLDQIVLEAQKQ